LAELLRCEAATAGPAAALARYADYRQRPGRNAAAAVPGLVELLTGRELEVLAMLAAGTPNQAIAEELFVTLFTVKSTSATSWASWVRQPHRGRHPGTGPGPDRLTPLSLPSLAAPGYHGSGPEDSTRLIHLRLTL